MIRSDPADGCWLWPGAKSSAGYGQRRDGDRVVYVHRESYETHVGPVPVGLTIDHLCGNRACYNPAHLEAVTQSENVRRANARRTYDRGASCINGHPLDGRRSDSGSRGGVRQYCKTCERERMRERRKVVA